MASFPFQYININGIPTIQSRGLNVNTSAVNISFNPDWGGNPYRGLILVNLTESLPEGTTTTLPIVFTMSGRTEEVTLVGGDAWTAENYAIGVYLLYYDRIAGTLQLLTNV